MPQCDCGRQIRSGRQCRECTLDDVHGQGVGDHDQEPDDYESSTILVCQDCGRESWPSEGDSCPFCGSTDRRRRDDDDPDPVPMVRQDGPAATTVVGPEPLAFECANGGDVP